MLLQLGLQRGSFEEVDYVFEAQASVNTRGLAEPVLLPQKHIGRNVILALIQAQLFSIHVNFNLIQPLELRIKPKLESRRKHNVNGFAQIVFMLYHVDFSE